MYVMYRLHAVTRQGNITFTKRLVLRGAGDHEARGANEQDDLSEEKSRIIIK